MKNNAKTVAALLCVVLTMALTGCKSDDLSANGVDDVVIKDNTAISEQTNQPPTANSQVSQTGPSSLIEEATPSRDMTAVIAETSGMLSESTDRYGNKTFSGSIVANDANPSGISGSVTITADIDQWYMTEIELSKYQATDTLFDDIYMTIKPYIESAAGTMTETQAQNVRNLVSTAASSSDVAAYYGFDYMSMEILFNDGVCSVGMYRN